MEDQVSAIIEEKVTLGPPNSFTMNGLDNYKSNDLSEFNEEQENEILVPIVLCINEVNFWNCSEVEIVFKGGTGIRVIFDSGREVNQLAKRVYGRIVTSSAEVLCYF
jgi:hypothetical protein